MPTCPSDGSEMVSTAPATRADRGDHTVHSSRCCTVCGYSE